MGDPKPQAYSSHTAQFYDCPERVESLEELVQFVEYERARRGWHPKGTFAERTEPSLPLLVEQLLTKASEVVSCNGGSGGVRHLALALDGLEDACRALRERWDVGA